MKGSERRCREGGITVLGQQESGAEGRPPSLPKESTRLNCYFPQVWPVLLCLPYSYFYGISYRVGPDSHSLSDCLTGVSFQVNFIVCIDLPQHEGLGPVSTSEEIPLKVVLWRHFSK